MNRRVSFAVAAGALLVSTEAAAFEFGTPASERPHRSAQHFALELRLSPYYPNVDEEPGLKGAPFQQSFGDAARVAIGLELDWQTYRIPYVGTIGPGVGVGRVSMSRPARTLSGRESGDEYGLTIYPLYLSAVLRVDALWRGGGFPLVPYGKLGAAIGFWDASTASGTATAGGVKGSGASWGPQVALGLAFALDVLDEGAARNMDLATGINNTYLYAEYYWLSLTNGLGQDKALYVGTNTWAAGLAFEF